MAAIKILFSYLWVIGEVLFQRNYDLELLFDGHKHDLWNLLAHTLYSFYFWRYKLQQNLFFSTRLEFVPQ